MLEKAERYRQLALETPLWAEPWKKKACSPGAWPAGPWEPRKPFPPAVQRPLPQSVMSCKQRRKRVPE